MLSGQIVKRTTRLTYSDTWYIFLVLSSRRISLSSQFWAHQDNWKY